MLERFKIGCPEDLPDFLSSTSGEIRGVQSGLSNLDRELRGLQGIVGLVGGPKACKSTLALQIALNNSAVGNPVLYIDRENGLTLMRERITCSYYNMCWTDFCKKSETQKTKAFQNLQRLPFYLVNCPFSMRELDEWLEALVPEKGKAVLVLDSLHKLPMDMDNMRSSVDKWLLFLDALKLKHKGKLTIIITCEKRRGAYGEAMRDSAKESGRIEYTLEQQLDLRAESGSIIIECVYNRHGPTGDRMFFEPMYSRAGDQWSFMFKLRERETVGL